MLSAFRSTQKVSPLFTHWSRTPRFVLAAALCAALLGAGCGGDSDEDKKYREGLTEAKKEFDQVLSATGSTGPSRRQFSRDTEKLQAAVDQFKAELGELDPPSEAEDAQAAVTKALDEFAGAVARTNAAVQAKDSKRAAAGAARVQATGVALDESLETLLAVVD
jgi:hypothetical protein